MENYKLVHQFKCNQGAVRAVNHNFDGKYCLTAGSNTTIKLWNHEKGNLLKTYSGHGQDVMDVRGSRDNSKIVSASKDKTVFLWDVLTGKSIKRYRYHAASVNNAQFNFYDNTIISASVDASVALWDLRTSSMKPMSVIKDARDTIVSLDVYDTIICYGSADGWVRINDIRMGLMMADCIGDGGIVSVAVASDMQSYLVGRLDFNIYLMDLKNGALLNEYSGHLNKEYKITCGFLHDEDFVVSGSENGSVYVWNTVTGSCHSTLDHERKIIHHVSGHNKTESILTASGDNVYLWQL